MYLMPALNPSLYPLPYCPTAPVPRIAYLMLALNPKPIPPTLQPFCPRTSCQPGERQWRQKGRWQEGHSEGPLHTASSSSSRPSGAAGRMRVTEQSLCGQYTRWAASTLCSTLSCTYICSRRCSQHSEAYQVAVIAYQSRGCEGRARHSVRCARCPLCSLSPTHQLGPLVQTLQQFLDSQGWQQAGAGLAPFPHVGAADRELVASQ